MNIRFFRSFLAGGLPIGLLLIRVVVKFTVRVETGLGFGYNWVVPLRRRCCLTVLVNRLYRIGARSIPTIMVLAVPIARFLKWIPVRMVGRRFALTWFTGRGIRP